MISTLIEIMELIVGGINNLIFFFILLFQLFQFKLLLYQLFQLL
jgi:hypothetical protein